MTEITNPRDGSSTAEGRSSPSRRVILAGSLGALAGWAAGAIGRVPVARAADGDPILIGATNEATTGTLLENTTNNAAVLAARSTHDGSAISGISLGAGSGVTGSTNNGTGVHGIAEIGDAVRGHSTNGEGVHGEGGRFGVYGSSGSPDYAGVFGTSASGLGTGVQGSGGRIGVYGTGSKKGVSGFSIGGWAVHGASRTGYAGYFDGRVMSNHSFQLTAGGKKAVLFLREAASGDAQLCVRFNNGTVRVLATD